MAFRSYTTRNNAERADKRRATTVDYDSQFHDVIMSTGRVVFERSVRSSSVRYYMRKFVGFLAWQDPRCELGNLH